MAAEFDSSAFSAVDKFFGGGTETAATEEKKVSYNAPSRGKRRGGVGVSTKPSDTKTLSSDLLAKQVLTVGRKRGRDDSNEDDYDGDVIDDHGVHDGDEADGGRTSIAQKKKIIAKALANKTSKPTKKLGRKERQRQKQAAKADANQENQTSTEMAHTDTTNEGEGDVVHPKDGNQAKMKRKRRKVRSRQKNIRKDNRSADEKPAHLIPGSRNYQGRPMTEATREKLNLPAPIKKPFRNTFSQNKGDDLFVIDRNPDAQGDDLGVKLAIDELMGNDDNGDVETGAPLHESVDAESGRKDKKKSSKKKKKKFKNL